MKLELEPTKCGLQYLLPTIQAVRMIDRLMILLEAPLYPKNPQKPLNIGLFDETARNQLELFS